MVLNYLSNERINFILNFIKSNYRDDIKNLKKLFYYIDSKEKVYISDYDLLSFRKNLKIMNLGLYFGKFHKEKFRLSQEGCNVVEPKRNYLILKEKSLNSFLYGENLLEEDFENVVNINKSIFLPVKYNDKFLGCVLYLNKDFKNFISKGRKIEFNKII